MSGHNKWSKIKHRKAATDAKKSKIFSKLVKLISVEAKKGGGDVNSPGLRMAIEKARKENMPADNIERAIKKANESPEAVEDVMYEAYGPGGVGMIIVGLTDNKNRASAEIKNILSKNGASLGAQGSVTWGFTKEGMEWKANETLDLSDQDIEKLSKIVDELEDNDDVQDVYTNAE